MSIIYRFTIGIQSFLSKGHLVIKEDASVLQDNP